MLEEIYIISQKYSDGGFNKIAKSQELWWYSAHEAIAWLKKTEPWFQIANAVFKVTIDDDQIEKVFDGKGY